MLFSYFCSWNYVYLTLEWSDFWLGKHRPAYHLLEVCIVKTRIGIEAQICWWFFFGGVLLHVKVAVVPILLIYKLAPVGLCGLWFNS